MAHERRPGFGPDLRRMRDRFAAAFHTERIDPRRRGLPPGDVRKRSASVSPLISIRDVMEQDLATVLPDTSLRHAVQVMIRHRISSIPVVDEEGLIEGALNEGDLMQVFYEPGVEHVRDVMTRDPIVLSVDAPFVDVIDRLMSTNFRRVLIHHDLRLVGVITRSHVMPALLAALEQRAEADVAH